MEIKFRAWDSFNECYYYSDNYKNLGEFFTFCQTCIDADNGIIYEPYTNRKDRNRKEIYVGDVVELRGGRKPKGEDRPFYQTTVVFKKNCFTVENNASIWTDLACLNVCTVISNIHETNKQNPH